MTAADLLARCETLGITLAPGPYDSLTWEADVDPPPDLLEALTANKAQVLALLPVQGAVLSHKRPSKPSNPPTGPWDVTAADAALAAVNARLGRALAPRGEADTPARRNVVESRRRVVAAHHRDRDPLLWDDLEEAERLLARWRAGRS